MQTRTPTGAAGWPMLLVEGKEGARKTSEALRLSADPRIGSSYVIEVGERRVDEYATLGNFMVVEHDGKLANIVRCVYDVMAQPPLEGRPTLLIIDSGTALWDLVKRQAELYARSSKEAKRKLEDDPNAEIQVGHQAWNRAKDPWWWAWMNDLRAWPGVLIVTARSDEVSKFVDGKPVANQTDYRVDIERGTPFIFDATVRMRGAKAALVTTAKSLNFSVPDAGVELPVELPLAHLVFDLFKAGTNVELTTAQAKTSLVAMARSLGHSEDSAKAAAGEAWRTCNASSKSKFDHLAMSFLIDSLPSPTPDVDPDPASTPDVDPNPDVEPAADVPGEPATAPADGPEGVEQGDDAPEPSAITEDGDRDAFAAAPQAVLDDVLAQVRRLDTDKVDAELRAQFLPTSGNVATRRSRLAARFVHLAMRDEESRRRAERANA